MKQFIILFLMVFIVCTPGMTESERRQWEVENIQIREFSQYYFFNKYHRIGFWVSEIHNTNVKNLEISGMGSVEIMIGSKSLLRRMVSELDWNIQQSSQRRYIDGSWYQLLEHLKFMDKNWR